MTQALQGLLLRWVDQRVPVFVNSCIFFSVELTQLQRWAVKALGRVLSGRAVAEECERAIGHRSGEQRFCAFSSSKGSSQKENMEENKP